MQKTTFIILSSSYVVRKGITAVINQIDDTLVYDELDHAKDLSLASPYHIPDYLIVDYSSVKNPDLTHIKNYSKKFNVQIIAIAEEQNNKKFLTCRKSIGLYDSEEIIKQKLLYCIGNNSSHRDKKNSALSNREKNVLQLVAQGYTNKEIAEKLFISLHTVITHRKNITKKLGIKTVSGLTVYAILNNIIELKDIEQ